jgi:hypothetical protein
MKANLLGLIACIALLGASDAALASTTTGELVFDVASYFSPNGNGGPFVPTFQQTWDVNLTSGAASATSTPYTASLLAYSGVSQSPSSGTVSFDVVTNAPPFLAFQNGTSFMLTWGVNQSTPIGVDGEYMYSYYEDTISLQTSAIYTGDMNDLQSIAQFLSGQVFSFNEEGFYQQRGSAVNGDPEDLAYVGTATLDLADSVFATPPTATPLPSTWSMLIAGFVGLGFFAYRGAKKGSAALTAA